MLDALSDALARQVFSHLAQDRAHRREELDVLPTLIARALRQRLTRETREMLDVVAPWVSESPEAWTEHGLKDTRYPATEWETAVRETCRSVLSTLVDPAHGLAAAAVPGETAPAAAVLARMRAFGAYPYLAEIVERYAQKKDMASFGREELARLLERIDSRVATELDVEGWMALLNPLYELVGGIPEQEGEVPGLILGDAFRARGLPGIGAAVVSHPGLKEDDLSAILVSVLAKNAESTKPRSSQEGTEVFQVESMPALASGEEGVADAEIMDESARTPEAGDEPDGDEPAASDFLLSLDSVASGDEYSGESDDAQDAEPLADLSEREAGREETDASAQEAAEPAAREPIEDLPEVAPLLPEPFEPDEEDVPPSAEAQDESPIEDIAAPEDDTEPDDEPLWKSFARGTARPPAPEAAPHDPTPREAAAPPDPALDEDSEDDDTPLWRRFTNDTPRGAAPLSSPSAGAPLHETIGSRPAADALPQDLETAVLGDASNHRDWYVEHLFADDETAYHRVIAQLARSRSWTDATQIIGREVFRRYKVNIYSEPAVSFTEAVENQLRRE